MKHTFVRLLTKLFVPAWVDEMEQEDIFRLRELEGTETLENECFLVEDNQADVTIFAFSGLDGLFPAGPKFEFRKCLGQIGDAYNLVFVRELRGFSYHRAPDGEFNGLAFYENRTRAIMRELGASTNIAVGFSSGGAAAVYFAARCSMQKVIAIAPAFPFSVYLAPGMQLRHWFDVRKMVTAPKEYIAVSVVTVWVFLLSHRVRQAVGAGNVWDVKAAFRDAGAARPRTTIVYGSRCRQDRAQAEGMREFPEVAFTPVATGTHDLARELKLRGALGPLLQTEIADAISYGKGGAEQGLCSNLDSQEEAGKRCGRPHDDVSGE